jgi:AcrR family transcriptional regulator
VSGVEASTPARAETAGRGRRAQRASGDDREREILATAERLLEERPLNEISVDDLARGAGISRPTFYFYFPSKDAVVLTLIDRLVEEAGSGREAAIAKALEDPRAGWRQGIEAFYEAFRARRSLILAGVELRATNPEARRLWSQVMEGWVTDVSEVIEAERERGAAPRGVPARQLATALVQMNERAQYASLSGEEPALAGGEVLDVLVEIWLRAIYGSAAPPV